METGRVAIHIENISKTFKLPHDKSTSIKSALISFSRGNHTYEKQEVLKDINFDINEGDFFGIVGRNGSGKSTLLKLLAGIYTPDKGTILVNGKLTPFIELGVGFNPELSGRENVFLNGALLGFNRKEIEAMYDDIVEFAELHKFMDQKLKNYSSGMQVRLAFSIAIKAETDILLLDEVLAVGDAAFQQKCFDYFEDLKKKHTTVIFVSHDMGAVRRFCNKAVYIDKGRVTLEGSPEDVARVYALDNIREDKATAAKLGASFIMSKIIKQDDNSVTLGIEYNSTIKDEVYVGISLTRDGASVGEITTSPKKPLKGKGTLTYTFNTDMFNGGTYQVAGVSLFKLHNRELVAVSENRNEFVVNGSDITRGAAVKLPDTWKYPKN